MIMTHRKGNASEKEQNIYPNAYACYKVTLYTLMPKLVIL